MTSEEPTYLRRLPTVESLCHKRRNVFNTIICKSAQRPFNNRGLEIRRNITLSHQNPKSDFTASTSMGIWATVDEQYQRLSDFILGKKLATPKLQHRLKFLPPSLSQPVRVFADCTRQRILDVMRIGMSASQTKNFRPRPALWH